MKALPVLFRSVIWLRLRFKIGVDYVSQEPVIVLGFIVLSQFPPDNPNSIINLGKPTETSLFLTPGQVESCTDQSLDN